MRTLMIILVGLLLAARSAVCSDHYKKCDNATISQIDRDISKLEKTNVNRRVKWWDLLYTSFTKHLKPGCDDGEVAEGYSDVVCKMLANDWRHSGDLFHLMRKDKNFTSFIFLHINATCDWNDLNRIAKNSKVHCPSIGREICRKLEKASLDSVKVSKGVLKGKSE